MDYKL